MKIVPITDARDIPPAGNVSSHSRVPLPPSDSLSPKKVEKKESTLLRTLVKIFIGILFPPLGIYWLCCKPKSQPTRDLPLFSPSISGLLKLVECSFILPTPIHYNEFNGSKSGKIQEARENMNSFFFNQLQGEKKGILAKDSQLPSWTMKDLFSLKDDEIFKIGQFPINGAEIKKMAQSLVVGYDPTIVDQETLNTILLNGASEDQDQTKARGRMVSSLTASVVDSRGDPIFREEGELPLYRTYTTNAPNLVYSPHDRETFIKTDGTLDKEVYQKEMERIFIHFFNECSKNGDKIPIIPGFGLGAFMPTHLRPEGEICFIDALEKAYQKMGHHFDGMIFADPSKDLAMKVLQKMVHHRTVFPSDKSCLDVAHLCASLGLKGAVLNPGDGSGIPGQFWYNGHIALEEMFGLFTTLLIGQHPSCNPLLKDQNHYRENSHPSS